jgi:Trypsin
MKRVLVTVMAAGCVTPEAGDVGSELATVESTIIGGVRSIGVEATVMLVGFPPNRSVLQSCTAVVVSPTVLLTSAHCVDAPNHPNYLYGVFTGDDASAYPALVDLEPQLKMAASVHPHPQYSPDLPFYADIATVVMAAPLPIAPAPMQRTPLDTSVIGKPARIVGYGQITYGEYNSARYEAMTTVASMENDTVVVGDATKRSCLGDSGGPAFVDGVVIGIDSYGPVGCNAVASIRSSRSSRSTYRCRRIPSRIQSPIREPIPPTAMTAAAARRPGAAARHRSHSCCSPAS